MKTEQHPDSAAKGQAESNHRASPSNPNAIVEQQHPANDPKGEADKDADKRADEAREYWPFHIFLLGKVEMQDASNTSHYSLATGTILRG